jgi:hypothetical protein
VLVYFHLCRTAETAKWLHTWRKKIETRLRRRHACNIRFSYLTDPYEFCRPCTKVWLFQPATSGNYGYASIMHISEFNWRIFRWIYFKARKKSAIRLGKIDTSTWNMLTHSDSAMNRFLDSLFECISYNTWISWIRIILSFRLVKCVQTYSTAVLTVNFHLSSTQNFDFTNHTDKNEQQRATENLHFMFN